MSPCHLGIVCNPHFLPQLITSEKQILLGGEGFLQKMKAQKVITLEYLWDEDECFASFSISSKHEEWHTEVAKELLVKAKDVEVKLDTIVLSKPILVTNQKTKQQEIILFDASNQMMLISPTGEVRWKKQLGSSVIGEVEEIDLYRNGKIQYLVTTKNKIYCIDRLGRDVEGFPWSLPSNELISGSSIFDYERNKKYRVLVTSVSGDMYLYDKSHKNLEGWELSLIHI